MLNELMTKVERAVSAIEKVAAALEKLAMSQAPAGVAPVTEGKKSSGRATKDTSKSSAASAPSTAPVAASNPPAAQPTPEVPATTPPAADEMEDDDFGAPAAGDKEAKVWTADDIRAAAVKLAGAKGEEIPKKIIKEVGNSPNIKSMDPSKFGSVMAAIQEAMK